MLRRLTVLLGLLILAGASGLCLRWRRASPVEPTRKALLCDTSSGDFWAWYNRLSATRYAVGPDNTWSRTGTNDSTATLRPCTPNGQAHPRFEVTVQSQRAELGSATSALRNELELPAVALGIRYLAESEAVPYSLVHAELSRALNAVGHSSVMEKAIFKSERLQGWVIKYSRVTYPGRVQHTIEVATPSSL